MKDKSDKKVAKKDLNKITHAKNPSGELTAEELKQISGGTCKNACYCHVQGRGLHRIK